MLFCGKRRRLFFFSDTGSFEVVPAAGNNRGPVGVREKYHFSYADGTPFYEIGTTCYAWAHQPAGTAGADAADAGGEPVQQDPFLCFSEAL
jgi:hypothetical protein